MGSNRDFFNFVCIFGDAKEHHYSEIFYLGVNLLDKERSSQRIKLFDAQFKKALWCGLISKMSYGDVKSCNYILTDKGDSYIRSTAIRLGGSAAYYRNFSRTPESAERYGS